MGDRAALLKKLAALKAKTTASGCTEAEAMAAAEKLAELMAEYGVSDAEIGMTEAAAKNPRASTAQWRRVLANVAAECTNTAVIFDGDEVVFVGADPGPEIARYLFDVCRRAVERALTEFRATSWYKRRRTAKAKRAAGTDFVDSMAYQLSLKLWDIFGHQMSDDRRSAAEKALALRFPDSRTLQGKKNRETRYHDAARLGAAAGDAVPLSHGVGGGAGPLRIGRGS